MSIIEQAHRIARAELTPGEDYAALHALIADLLEDGVEVEADPAELTLQQAAEQAYEAREAGFRKALIEDVATVLGRDLHEVKAALWAAHLSGELELASEDMTDLAAKRLGVDMAASEIRHPMDPTARFHYVKV